MADTVTSRIITDDALETVVHLTCISDGTGEAAVVKVDKSALVPAQGGAEAVSLDIIACRWAVQGFSSVTLLWDHTTDAVALVLSGNGYDDFGAYGVENPGAPLPDPRSSGGAGDILLTSAGAGAASGATYDITLTLRKAAT